MHAKISVNNSLRRRSPSPSPRWRKSRSPTPRRRKSRSPSPRRYKRQRSRSTTRSPINKSQSPSLRPVEHNNSIEKLKKEEEQKRRFLFLCSTHHEFYSNFFMHFN
ncbi:hypothetical protein HPP92_009170 [Vanilla planifolia]|uniref:Uncharacterized protein n=1 Tax=Vanilla planifolia TaxID=51239 RepID=A0A835V7X4_VANPL|nr:hypothetical protein HPP92_009170 [Vanilla planifolia]